MTEVYRYFDLQIYSGQTVEITLENGAIYRGILSYKGQGDNYIIEGKEGARTTYTEFVKGDMRSLTTFSK